MSGLVIAIPSAVLAHYYDNRIVAWFHRIDELTTSMTPMFEQFEGKLRTSASFDMAGESPYAGVTTTISSPHVRIMGDVAVIAYVRLTQRVGEDGKDSQG